MGKSMKIMWTYISVNIFSFPHCSISWCRSICGPKLFNPDARIKVPSTGYGDYSVIHGWCCERVIDGERNSVEGEIVEWKCNWEDLVQPQRFPRSAEMLRSVTSHPTPSFAPSTPLSLKPKLPSLVFFLSSLLLLTGWKHFLSFPAMCYFDKQIYWLRHISSLF